jgi:hypothetical protein
MKWQTLFLSLMPIVEKFVEEKSRYYNIDVSHNLHHSLQVKELGFVIAEHDYHLDTRQKEILYLSCMLHDMCDAKYIPRTQGILDVSNFIRNGCGVSMLTHDAVMEIITSMSYSQIVKPDGRVEYPLWLSVEGHDWAEVFHITRQADLLTSYDLKRMIHYKQEKLGFCYSCDIYQDVVRTVEARMGKLLEKGLLVSPSAIKIARQWHQELYASVETLTEDDVYPIFYKPPEPLEQFRQRIAGIL